MTDERFPYEQSQWTGSADEARRWYEALERMSPEDVRAHLARYDSSSRGAVSLGSATNMTKGFAEEWLAWKDHRKAQREDSFRGAQVFWTRWAALAASVAAAPAAIGWAITVWHKW